ncbi:MAG: DoxX family protein [bacterium]|nr:DoxX family protein [bacterium]
MNFTTLNNGLKKIGPAILRIGLALVYIWFGVQQILHTATWIGYIPESVLEAVPLEAGTLVHINGAFEIFFAFSLLLGMFTRLSALLLAVHMFDVTFIVGFDAIGVRDFGLSIGTLAVFFFGADILCLEKYIFGDDTPVQAPPAKDGATTSPSTPQAVDAPRT